MTYEELVQALQSGSINELEFIDAQSDLKSEYQAYLNHHRLQTNQETARLFLIAREEDATYNTFCV